MNLDVTRRGFLATTAQAQAAAALVPDVIDVRDFKAAGDGKTDDTAAIQKAVDKAAATKASVQIPDGSLLLLHASSCIPTSASWATRPGTMAPSRGLSCDFATARPLACSTAPAAYGARLTGLSLDGGNLGNGIHGVLVNKPDYGKREDAIFIERCRIGNFTGDGIHLSRIWLFTVRHNMVCHNRGNGLWFRGWDGFVLDNWFSGNHEAGIGAYNENASCTITGNRIEWNARGGLDPQERQSLQHHGKLL